jgi:hypothetical protein
MALGSGSSTVAMTSIASSLLMHPLIAFSRQLSATALKDTS